MTNKSFGLRACLMAGAALFMFAAEARAQQATEVEEIVVTAQRRSENIQEVPLSVATLPISQLSTIFDSGNDITALATRVPGLYAESSNGRIAPRFYIRGLGNTDFDLAASQPVSVIMDEVVLENVSLKSSPIFDIERVEVLRGPQGTLFGRNTPAGIIKFDTVKPSEEFKAYGSGSIGTFNTLNLETGVGGPIVAGAVLGRISALYQHRDNWIDNGFTGQDDVLGGYDEFALRGQLQLNLTDDLNLLFNVHTRHIEGEGPGSVFRANVLGPTNSLNGNFDRDTVYLDGGGGNNPQDYRGTGGSMKATYNFPSMTFTSITALEHANGLSRADVDGGNLVTGPGFIPFPSDTQDSIDHDQFTQEFRLASAGDGPMTWQVGAFYFNSQSYITTVGFDFPPPVTVHHSNDSYAVFGQTSYQVNEALKITGGLRYTNDEKDFNVVGGSPTNNRSVSDSQVSWDLSALYAVSDDINLYARVATGFRAPSIQGRDVAFFSPPSVANSEKIFSAEAGVKTQFADRRVRLNATVFTYTVEDPQFTAVGGGGNLVQLINADKGTAMGVEVDSQWIVTDNLTLTGGLSLNSTEIDDGALLVGVCAQCTVTDQTLIIGGQTRALVNGNPFPNAPTWIADITARYAIPMGDDGELFVFTDWAYQGETNPLLYESKEFTIDGQFEGGLRIGYAKYDKSWELALFARNITDEENVKGVIDFNNLTAFVNEPRVIGVSLRASIR